ncbi:hypothetical protein [Amycolatopsis sp. NPDC051071]|uniref:hypothetical protein n=1 Tax=Amycolatopsis sp. NPDC051071 TaxID=3154637 RepID=UPI00344A9726
MTGRGWRLERQVRTLDTVGRIVDVTAGLIRDSGVLVVAVGIGQGPTAILRGGALADLVTNLQHAQDDVVRLEQRGGRA